MSGPRTKRLLVPPELLHGDEIELTGDDHHHLVRVMRLGQGARIQLADGAGRCWEGTLVRADRRDARVQITSRLELPPPPRPRMTLIYGVARGGRSDLVMQKTTELGVDELWPVICERSVARPSERPHRWRTIIRQAARQSERGWLPQLHDVVDLADAIADRDGSADVELVAHPKAPPLSERRDQLAGCAHIAIAVGPEGGFSPHELESLGEAGFVRVGLGELVLRSETAAIAALAAASALGGRF